MGERSSHLQQSPPTPIYVLRGHAAPIHALHIFNQNLRLVSGDANGWIVVWDLVTKRSVAVWKAHEGAVLEVKGFSVDVGVTEIYTHGRDHRLCVWRLRAQDESFLDKTLPIDAAEPAVPQRRNQPWLLHSLPVNALNFCAFSMTFVDTDGHAPAAKAEQERPGNAADPQPLMTSSTSSPERASQSAKPAAVLFAVPNALDSGGVDVFHLPSERRITTVPSDSSIKTGMVMAISLFVSSSGDLHVAAAYEDGHVMAFVHRGPLSSTSFERSSITTNPWKWEKVYVSRSHTQPVLSIDISPAREYFVSSSADALIIKHPIPSPGSARYISTASYQETPPLKIINTKHSGQQGLRIRSDGKVFAAAGWDSRIRVYSGKTMKELAVLKWHKEGCYAVAFGVIESYFQEPVSSSVESSEPDIRETTREAGPEQMGSPGHDFSLATVQHQRNLKVQETHWLAAGSKDGKISLWDVY